MPNAKGLGYSQNRRVSGQRLCLLILQISISADRDVPAFSKAGTFFSSPILKKTAEKCPLYSRGLFENIAQLFPDKRRKHVRVLYGRKIFRPPICRNFVRCKVRGNHLRDTTVTLRIILSVGKEKGQFGSAHRDCFAVLETFLRKLGQNRSLIHLAK